jgi:hypothetical protein
MCKFQRPSNRLLSQLEANGIEALDNKGAVITANTLLPNTRPDKYRFKNINDSSTGVPKVVTADELPGVMSSNAEARSAIHDATQTRFASLSDSVFDFIKTKFGFTVNNKLKDTKDESGLVSEVDDTVKPANADEMKAAASGEAKAAGNELEEVVKAEAEKEVEQLGKKGKTGGLTNLVLAGTCMVTDIPGLISKAARSYQMIQLVKYSSLFLSAFGAIKAGDATPEEMTAVGDTLTQSVDGKSAMDSDSILNVTTGSTMPTSGSYTNFVPGLAAASIIGKTAKFTSSEYKVKGCNTVTSPAFAAGVETTLAADPFTWPELIGNIALGYGLGFVIEHGLAPMLGSIISVIPVNKIIAAFYPDLTQGLAGANVGDALTSGASHVMGQTANAGGNVPLTPNQAVAYDGLTKQVQLAYAEEDRATKSPFDISSPNTMMGSIVQKFIPFFTKSSSAIGSATNTISTMASIVMGSFSSILQPLTAGAESTDSSQYTDYCQIPELAGKGDDAVAVGPYCNIMYGIPVNYINKSDPIEVAQKLLNDGQIDKTTGDPIPDTPYAIWKSLCTDGSANQAKSCKVTDETANYSLYTVYNRINNGWADSETTTTTAAEPSV